MVILLFLYGNFMAPTTRSNSGFVGIWRPRTSTGSRGQDLALIDGGWTTSCARCSFLGMVEKVHEFVGQGGAGPITMHEQQQHAVHHDL